MHPSSIPPKARGNLARRPSPSIRTAAWRAALPPLLLLVAAAACGSDGADARGTATLHLRAPATPAGRVLQWVGAFDLEETPDVVNVEPEVSLDPRGGFLVADAREAQVRRYGSGGKLLWHVGTRGGGPGEFEAATAVARLPSGEIVAADRTQRLTVFDSAGTRAVRTLGVPLGHIEDLDVVDDSLVLVAAMEGDNPAGPRLHLWNLARNRPAARFFAPFAGARNRTAAMVAGWSKAAVRDGTVAAVFATSDTVYFFTTAGAPLGKVRIPFLAFRRGDRMPPDGAGDPRARARWLASFDFVAGVHWLPDGTLLVPFQNVSPERALERQWHLLRMSRTGERIWEVHDLPRLLEVDSRTGALLFLKPGADAPNQWALARLRG